MTANNNPFNPRIMDLGDKLSGISRLDVDNAFSVSNINNGTMCLICTNTPMYRLIPKHDRLNTAEIQDKGFICGLCMENGFISNKEYGLRKL